jgi:hypothetical protein
LHKGRLSSPYCLAKVAVQSVFGRSPLPPYPQLRIETGAGDAFSGPHRVLIASTLMHRDSLFNPYAERGAGLVRMTAITADAPAFWRHLPRVLTGHFTADMSPQHGYLSGRFERVTITGLRSCCLDGEMFDTNPAQPVLLAAGPPVRMLQL